MGNAFAFFEQGSIEVTSFSNVIDNDHRMTLAILVLLRAAIPLNTQLMLQMFPRPQFLTYLLQVIFRILEKTLIQKMAYHLFSKHGGSDEGTLSVGETAIYTTSHDIDSSATSGTIKFYVKAVADSQGRQLMNKILVIMVMIMMETQMANHY
ncbi:MAG: hypothetical protein CM15mP83_6990 [Flavobacteriaceae bacterium]|nr:MAG: hypothetical protein CM15mP83_6990 [Flavobacteriaceae bacterium]